MSQEVKIKTLFDDYVKNQDERDNAYIIEEKTKILFDNIKALGVEFPKSDWKRLEDNMKLCLTKEINPEKYWIGLTLPEIIDDVIDMQKEEGFGPSDANELLAFMTLYDEEADILSLSDTTIKHLFHLKSDCEIDLQDFKDAVIQQPLQDLYSIFSAIFTNEDFDIKSVLSYIQELNESKLEAKLNVELLYELVEEKFEDAWIKLFLTKAHDLLIKTVLDENEIGLIFEHFDNLKKIGWNAKSFFRSVEFFLEDLTKKDDVVQSLNILKECFEIAFDYDMNEFNFVIEIYKARLANSNGQKKSLNVFKNDFCTKAKNQMGETHEKSLEELLLEICEYNEIPPKTTSHEAGRSRQTVFNTNDRSLDIGSLKRNLEDVKSALKSNSNLIGKPIESCSRNDITAWVEKLRKGQISPPKSEQIAFVVRGFQLFSGLKIRDIQLLSLLTLYKPEAGTLVQINTGEGKTFIIAMLAILFSLEGKKVDIVTSSTELAAPQAEAMKEFYEIFGLSSSHINVRDKKQVYKLQIIYGSIDEFNADVLKDEYTDQGIRSQRPFEIAIVDEVDSMLVDGKDFMVRLSAPLPGMNELEHLLAAISLQVDMVAGKIYEEHGIAYYIDDINKEETSVPLKVTKLEFLKTSVEDHMRMLLKDIDRVSDDNKAIVDKYPDIHLPKYLRNFVLDTQLKQWVDNAIRAKFYCVEGRDYIIKDKSIKIVDVDNTGIVHENMTWSDGLQQFLQLKHGLKITSEQVTTNFIANPTFFKRYGQSIYGLTGTLGSCECQTFLKNTYDVKLIVMPPYKLKLHIEMSPIINESKSEWYSSIVKSSIRRLKTNTACLIIADSINGTEEIKKQMLAMDYPEAKILMYATEESQSVIQNKIQVGEVIISTNIAGRGTDIKMSKEVNNNGGLHVCLTVLPENERVELQNLGRTSRNGNPGTSQFVLLDPQLRDLATLQSNRDKANLAAFQNAAKDMRKILIRADVFQKYSKIFKIVQGLTSRPSDWGDIDQSGCSSEQIGEAVEERFGFWLKENEKFIDDLDRYQQNYAEWEKTIKKESSTGKLIKNPYYFIQSGATFINEKNNEQAIKQFTKAISIEPDFSANAYYGRGCALVANGKIDEAIKDFVKARELLEERKVEIHLIQQAGANVDSSDLSEQMMRKTNLYQIQLSSINRAIGFDNIILDHQIEGLNISKTELQNQLNNFISQESLTQQMLETEEKIKKETPNISAEDVDKLKTSLRELDNKILSFQSKEDIEKNLADIDASIEALLNEKEEVGVLIDAKTKNMEVELSFIGLDVVLSDSKSSYDDEIEEFQKNGYIGGFEISETPSIDWWSVIGVFLIGMVQVVAGAAIAVFSLGLGASIGIGLMLEGVSDVITSVRDGIINRNFNWRNWGIQKAISLTVTVVCAGFSAMKNALKAAYAVVRETTGVITESIKAGWKLTAKKIGIELSKGVAREVTAGLIQHGLDVTIMKAVENIVYSIIQPKIEAFFMSNIYVKKMLLLDVINKNHNFENIIQQEAASILDSSASRSALSTYANGVAKGILSQKIEGAATVISAVKAVADIKEATTLVGGLLSGLEARLKIEAEKIKTNTQKHNKYTLCSDVKQRQDGDIDLSVLKKVNSRMASEDSVKINGELWSETVDELAKMNSDHFTKILPKLIIELGLVQPIEDTIVTKIKSSVVELIKTPTKKAFLKDDFFKQKFIGNTASDNVFLKDEILTIFQNILCSTQSHKTFSNFTFEVSESLRKDLKLPDDELIKLVEIFKRELRTRLDVIDKQEKGIDSTNLVDLISDQASNQITNIVKRNIALPLAHSIASFGVNTITSSLDKALSENISNYKSERRLIESGNKDPLGQFDEFFLNNYRNVENVHRANFLIDEVRNGSELGLIHLGFLSQQIDCPIQVLDENGKLAFIVGESLTDKKSIRVEYHPPSDGWPQGHWTLPGNHEALTKGSGKNDCLLNVICDQVQGQPAEMRKNLAQNMKENQIMIANAMPDYSRLSRLMRSRLYEGGAAYSNFFDIIVNSDGQHSHNEKGSGKRHKQDGHPAGHIIYSGNNDEPLGGIPRDRFVDFFSARETRNEKSALPSFEIARRVWDVLLSTDKAKTAFAQLNENQKEDGGKVDLKFTRDELAVALGGDQNVPEVISYWQGTEIRRNPLEGYMFILRHRRHENKNPNAGVFVQTAFPIPQLPVQGPEP